MQDAPKIPLENIGHDALATGMVRGLSRASQRIPGINPELVTSAILVTIISFVKTNKLSHTPKVAAAGVALYGEQLIVPDAGLVTTRDQSPDDVVSDRRTPESTVAAIATGDIHAAIDSLETLACATDEFGLSRRFLLATASALLSGDWTALSTPFQNHEFLGKDGQFLIIAPYTARRLGEELTRLSAIYGRVLRHDTLPEIAPVIHEIFNELRQPVPVVLPVDVFAAAGMLDEESGEAFIVPDGWPFPGSKNGPALNNMKEQRRRFAQAGQRCIRAIFEPETADLLLSPLADEKEAIRIQHLEYQTHDVGHACGIGLERKLEDNLLSNPAYRAVEEWRADGVAFEIASRLLPVGEVAKLVSSNFATRFGIDAQRAGGLETDTDVNATLLTLHYLIQGGAMIIGKTGRFTLSHPTPRGLAQAVELMRAEAVALTRKELQLSNPCGIWALYANMPIQTVVRLVFEQFVRAPCCGFFESLQ